MLDKFKHIEALTEENKSLNERRGHKPNLKCGKKYRKMFPALYEATKNMEK
jgi:hypothetical protein